MVRDADGEGGVGGGGASWVVGDVPVGDPIRLPNNWRPREYQDPLWRYLAGGGRNAVVIAHRRWGKDDVSLHHTACAAHERVGSYLHLLPKYSQARKALWDQVNPHTGKRRVDEAFPAELRAATREDEMFIRFKNGSTWQLAGSDNYDNLVGTSYAGMVHSEYAISNPSAQSYFAPILMESKGWQLFITTPRGKNHAWSMYNHAVAMQRLGKDWYAERSPVTETGAMAPEDLAAELLRLQALHGDEYGLSLYEQEYMVSFEAATPGAIFADSVRRMEAEGRLSVVPLLEGLPVHTGWDLGRTDDTVCWWFQMFAGEPRLVDYHASNGKDVPFYAKVLDDKRKERGFEYGVNYLPHDARPRTLAASRSILQQFDDANREVGGRLGRFAIAPRLDKQEQIQAARATLNVAWVDAERCAKGVEAVRSYHREWDDEKRVFKDSPEHDWSSHSCDSLMTMAVAWKRGMIPRFDGEGASAGASDGRSIGPGLTFGERKTQHLRQRKRERQGMFS